MEIAALQAALDVRGYKPAVDRDGKAGRKTTAAIDAMLDGERIRHRA